MSIPNTFTNLAPLPVGQHLAGGHGLDSPVSSATAGYRLNHLMIRIRNPAESLHFYIDLMGMRTVFAMNTGPFTVYYLGYPQTEAHRADAQMFARETVPNPVLTSTAGLLELCHFHGSEALSPDEFRLSNGNVPPHLGFGHLGFTVPDVPAALGRLIANGVTVVKPLGRSTRESVPISRWESEELKIGRGDLDINYRGILDQIAFVQDPVSFVFFFVSPFHVGLKRTRVDVFCC